MDYAIFDIISVIKYMRKWDIKSTGFLVEQSIRKMALFENVFVVVNLVVGISTIIAYAVPAKNDKEFFLVLVMFEKFFPEFEAPLSFLYRVSSFVLLPVLAPIHMVMYFSGHSRAQFHMLVKCLENLNYGYDKLDLLDSLYDKEYQEEITRRLTFCIERHIRIYS